MQLPDNEVTLAAYTIPDEKSTMTHYNYAWTLVDQPKDGFTGKIPLPLTMFKCAMSMLRKVVSYYL